VRGDRVAGAQIKNDQPVSFFASARFTSSAIGASSRGGNAMGQRDWRRTGGLACMLGLALMGCADERAVDGTSDKGDEPFVLSWGDNPKADGTAEWMSASERARLEAAFDEVIRAGEHTIASLELEIARLEHTIADKQREIQELVARIEARRAELERQYNNNMLLCMFFPNPMTCVFANYLANDGLMRDYETRLAAARETARRAESDVSSYRARRDRLRAQLVPVRASKARLIALVRGGIELAPPPEILTDMAAAGTEYARVRALESIAHATRQEIGILVEIRNAAAELSATLDASLGTLRALATSVDELVRAARERFMSLLEAAIAGDGALVDAWLDREIAALTRRMLDALGWPLAELVDHLFATRAGGSAVTPEMIADALRGDDDEDDDDLDFPVGHGRHELTASSSDALGIYDLSQTTSLIRVTADFAVAELEVAVEISHSYRGDLRVWLEHESIAPIVLHDRTGGSAHDLRIFARFSLEPDEHVVVARGDWRLQVADLAQLDEGRLERWSLTLRSR